MKKFSWWKLVVGFVFYLFFHQLYDWIPNTIIGAILGESIGSVYAHMEMLFYSYIVFLYFFATYFLLLLYYYFFFDYLIFFLCKHGT